MNTSSSHSALWILALASGFAIASPRTVHAPAPAPAPARASAQHEASVVPQDRYLDLGAAQRGVTSEVYTAVRSPLAPEAPEPVIRALAVDETRYIDLGRRTPDQLPTPDVPAND